MTFAQITDGLDVIRKYGMEIVQFLITAVVVGLIIGTIIHSAFEPEPKPEPPVYFPDHPRSDEDGCTRIDGMEICPRAAAKINFASSPPVPISSNVSAGNDLTPIRDASGEKRFKAEPEAVKTVKLVANVLQVKKKIEVYSATYENSRAAYARNLGAKSEIVYSTHLFPNIKDTNKIVWAMIGLMGHEVGHVLYNENIMDDRWENEASAEYFAGIAIYRLGGDLNNAFEYSDMFSGEDDKHPPHVLGAQLTIAGWKQAQASHNDPSDTCRAGLIGENFQYKDRVCKAAVSCGNPNKPIKIACQSGDGSWNWL